MQCINSTQDKSVRFIHELAKKRAREGSGCFFLEGERAVSELSDAGLRVRTLIICKSFYETISKNREKSEMIDKLKARASEVMYVTDSVFKFLCDTVTPQGIGAVIEMPERPSLKELASKTDKLLILENLQDPGNMGTCIRTADAFSFGGVICVSDCVDVYNSKVLRSTVGSLFHVPVLVYDGTIGDLSKEIKSEGFTVYGAHPRGGAKSTDEEIFTGKTAVIIGNEGAGLTELAKRSCDKLVTIPMPGRAESLNAGIAASVIMYEIIRRKE